MANMENKRRWRASTQIHAPNPFTPTNVESNGAKDNKSAKGKEPNPLVELLHGAIEKNSIETIKSIFQVQSNPARRRSVAIAFNSSSPISGGDKNGGAPSTSVKDDDIVEWLLYPDYQGQTAFHICAQHGATECLQLLLDFATAGGTSPQTPKRIEMFLNSKDINGWTPLHTASVSGNLLLCEKLLHLYPFPKRAFKQKIKKVKENKLSKSKEDVSKLDKSKESLDPKLEKIKHNRSNSSDRLNVKEKDKKKLDESVSTTSTSPTSPHTAPEYNGPNINERNYSGSTALHYLVRWKPSSADNKTLFKKVLKELISRGGDINATNLSGETPLHHACFHERFSSVQWLIKHGANMDFVNKSGETPLHFAARRGTKRIVKYLLEKGCDFCIVGDFGSPAEVAANANHPDIVSLFYHHAKSKRTRSKSVPSNENKPTKVSEEDVLKELHYLAELGDYPAFLDVLEENKKLIDATDEFGKTCIMVACYHGNWQIVNYLLEQGANIKTKDHGEWLSIHYAALSPNENVLNLLLQHKDVDVKSVNKDGNTVLHYFAKNKNFTRAVVPQILSTLAQKGLNFNLQNKNGETALHNACWHGSSIIVKSLIVHKLELDIQNKNGETALHWAVRMGSAEIVNLLLQAGANKNHKGKEGTALDIARKIESEETDTIIQLLSGGSTSAAAQPSVEGGEVENLKIIVKDTKGLFQKILKSKGGNKPISTVQIVQFQADPKIHNWIISEEEIDIGPHLGSGRFGSVYKGTFRSQIVAIKVLDNVTQRDVILKEFEIMSSMRSTHIVYFYGMVTKPSICLVMQFCQKGSLASVLRNRDFQLDWALLFKWLKQIVEGVRDLHQWKPCIIHRDLKPHNILVDENETCYISDFGISRFVNEHNLSTLNKLRGTYAYCAPEIYFAEQATTKSDCYSLGIIIWELVTRCLTGDYARPYKEYANIQLDFQIIVQVAKNQLRPTIPAECPPEVAALITKCWAHDIAARPSCIEILQSIEELRQLQLANPKSWKTSIQKRDLEMSPAMANFFNQEKVIEDLYVKSMRPKSSKSSLNADDDVKRSKENSPTGTIKEGATKATAITDSVDDVKEENPILDSKEDNSDSEIEDDYSSDDSAAFPDSPVSIQIINVE